MTFQNEVFIYIGMIITILLVLQYRIGYLLKIKLLNNFGDPKIIQKFSNSIDYNKYQKKAGLMIVIIFLLCITLARPQWGNKVSKYKRRGLNIMIMLDVSKSMLVEDMKPNRLEKAKHQIDRFVDYLKGDRIGLLIFAGKSFVQCPLTIDYSAFRLFLDEVNQNTIPVPGTALADALKRAIMTFPEVEKKYKVIILLTDGEDHQGNFLDVAELAKDQGIIIYTIGIGTPNGDLIPIRNSQGNVVGYKKDRSGNPILSRLDEVTLEKVALLTGGKYYQATESEFELRKVYDDISKMERKMIFGKQFNQKEDRFQWFLFPAILLLIIEIYIKEKRV